MKEYNAKIFVENDKFNIIYECDKDKNTNCKGYGNCKECNYTSNSRYAKAKARQHDKTITDKQIIINLEKEIEYYRHKIDLLENANKENRDCINKQEDLDKTLEIAIDNEEYLIKYNSSTDVITLNAFLNKLINEQNINGIYKDKEFKIINKTRYKKQGKWIE